ncbi:lecithin retinol acyltransferase family protein [Paraburkholderia sp. RL18-101-BIB-B]
MPNWLNVGLREEPALGAHLISPRGGYSHHGIYAGNGNVVHYAGLARSFHLGPVEEATMASFAAGHEVWIEPSHRPTYDEKEAVDRARSRLGENRYSLLTNNCEHFCVWCLYGRAYSKQVHECLAHPCAVAHVAMSLLRAVFSTGPKRSSIGTASA